MLAKARAAVKNDGVITLAAEHISDVVAMSKDLKDSQIAKRGQIVLRDSEYDIVGTPSVQYE